jgi:hypothetical protein
MIGLAKKLYCPVKVLEILELLTLHRESADNSINLNPAQIQSKTNDYKNLVQKLDPWQPPSIVEKYFPKGTSRK